MKATKKALALLCAAACGAAALPAFEAPAVSAEYSVKYEFEDGVLTGCEESSPIAWTVVDEDAEGNSCDMTGWSGDGYVYIDQKGASAAVTVNVESAGLYQIDICYIQCFGVPKKVQYFNVNGANQGEVSFPFNSGNGWETLTAGYVQLKAGDNVIELKSYWGYTFLDYLVVKSAPSYLSELRPTRTLSNPNASDNTKRLYNYLCDCYGNYIISGQQENCGSHCYNINSYQQSGKEFSYMEDNEAEFEYLQSTTGKQPAIRGIDFLTYNTTVDYNDYAAERAIEWYTKKNGIPAISWHWSVPSTEDGTTAAFYVQSANANYTTFSISNGLEEGTWENRVLMADIAYIASVFQRLEDAGVPCIFRPLHEAEGAWFWWGAEGPEPCVRLYRLLYDQLTNVYGLDNIIWEWTSYTFITSADWYPGDDVVDMLGYDKYNAIDYQANLSAISATYYSLVNSTEGEKIVAMSENDTIPSLENLLNEKAYWLYFCPWYGNYLTSASLNPTANLIETYQSEFCITLDELPDLTTYTLEGYGENSVTVIYGDVNGDGNVNATDSSMVLRYSVGTLSFDADQLTAGDVNGDGQVNATDAAIISRYAVGTITSLPL